MSLNQCRLREVGTVTAAADLIGICRQTHYKWMRAPPMYCDAFTPALRAVDDPPTRPCAPP